MTNYPQQPQPKSGMPRWLIALLVTGIILVLGCGGCVTGCFLLARSGAQKAEELGKQIHDELEKERKAQEARARERGTPVPSGDDAPVEETRTTGGARMPANFPADVPVYTGFQPSFSSTNEQEGTGTVMFNGRGKAAAIAEYYKKDLTGKGWKLSNETSILGTHSQLYEKGGTTLSITVSPESDDANSALLTINYSKSGS